MMTYVTKIHEIIDEKGEIEKTFYNDITVNEKITEQELEEVFIKTRIEIRRVKLENPEYFDFKIEFSIYDGEPFDFNIICKRKATKEELIAEKEQLKEEEKSYKKSRKEKYLELKKEFELSDSKEGDNK